MQDIKKIQDFTPKILVFSTDNVSDPGIDLAGRNKMHYSPFVYVISLPCSSAIKPKWVLHAIEKGFDGIFIAADGTDCAHIPDCVTKTGNIVSISQKLLKDNNYEPARIKMAALCSVCAEPFQKFMKNFNKTLIKLGPVNRGAEDGL